MVRGACVMNMNVMCTVRVVGEAKLWHSRGSGVEKGILTGNIKKDGVKQAR